MKNQHHFDTAHFQFGSNSEEDERRGRRRETRRARGDGSRNRGGRKSLPLGRDLELDLAILSLADSDSINPLLAPQCFFAHPHFERERSRQRAIRDWMTQACILWGTETPAPEAVHFTLTDDSIARAALDGVDISEARGLRLVVIGRMRNVIKTGYWLPVRSGRNAA